MGILNGFGDGQQLVTAQMLLNGGRTRSATRKRKKASSRRKTKSVKRARTTKKRAPKARLVKGSAAAKAYMARIRKMRK